jgi:hypothetical protein
MAIIANDAALHRYEAAIQAGLVVAVATEKAHRGVPIMTISAALDYAEQHPSALDGTRVVLRANPEHASLPECAPWPKYTGMTWDGWQGCGSPKDPTDREAILSVPVFTETEWAEVLSFDAEDTLETSYPGLDWGDLHPVRMTQTIEERRIYEPSYGRFIGETTCEMCRHHFVRHGWGQWRIVAFNDGDGGRTSRRYFEQDWYGASLIDVARATADPTCVSAWQYDRLAIHAVQKVQMSWAYVRKETRPRAEVIAALREDLAALEAEEPLTPEQIHERTLDLLQDLTFDLEYDGRQGRASVQCLDDGTPDPVQLKARQDAHWRARSDWQRRQRPQFEHTDEWVRPKDKRS